MDPRPTFAPVDVLLLLAIGAVIAIALLTAEPSTCLERTVEGICQKWSNTP